MNLDVAIEAQPLIVVIDLLILALIGLARPMARDYGEDQGNGMTLVLLPPPKLPRLRQTVAFLAAFVTLVVIYHSIKGPHSPDELYRTALEQSVGRVVTAPAEVEGYLSDFSLGLRVLVVGSMLSLALTCRARPLRRLSIAVQILWYCVTVYLFDTLLLVFSVATGAGIGPGTLLGNWFAYIVGFLGLARMLYGNFALPKPTAVPFAGRSRLDDAILVTSTTVIGMCVAVGVLYALYEAGSSHARDMIRLLAPLPFSYMTMLIRNGLLAVIGALLVRRPEIGDERPPIDVIVPAYNEEAVIVATLRSIDAAAERYGGPVRVVLTDDGSTDRTRPLVEGAMGTFVAATGLVVDGRHGGKSAALNSALDAATAEIVIRIDADTILDPNALVCVPRWFRDPTVGLVEALMWPRQGRSVFHRLRLFEELRVFGMNHRILQSVDGINVVPGVFTAFRRTPAVELGGFTRGMNGEDGDFTMRMTRLGWRVRLDPQIVVYEDVPDNLPEIREQRVRWCRATIHNQARHGIYRAGFAAPSVWLSQTRQYFIRVSSPISLLLPVYLVLYAVFQGASRTPVLVFLSAMFVVQVSGMLVTSLLATGYGFGRKLGWMLLWPLWGLCLKVFSTESILSLPGRPLAPFARKQVITEAVVH